MSHNEKAMETTFTPAEFVGGPRDGDRIYVEYPPPPYFIIPLQTRSGEPIGVAAEPTSTQPNFRQGTYSPSNDVEEFWDFITVDETQFAGVEPSFRHEALKLLCAQSRNPRYYKWRGED